MTTLLLDCTHGSTKDGFARACLALLPEPPSLPEGVESALRDHAGHHHDHHHHSLQEVERFIRASGAAPEAQRHACEVYGLLAQAEAKAHATDVDSVHFHEVGSAEAVAYVLMACIAMDALSPSRIVATPVCTGFGFVDCAHGRLPIPAPATANVLEGVPSFAGEEEGELTTPTGAALVVHFAEGFSNVGEAEPVADVTMLCNPAKVC